MANRARSSKLTGELGAVNGYGIDCGQRLPGTPPSTLLYLLYKVQDVLQPKAIPHA
jgi:hypothetical protein